MGFWDKDGRRRGWRGNHAPAAPYAMRAPTGRAKAQQTPIGDAVNHPAHYTAGKMECIDALEAATEGLTGINAVCTANAIKYLWRWKNKGGAQDLRKAVWHIERLLKVVEEKER